MRPPQELQGTWQNKCVLATQLPKPGDVGLGDESGVGCPADCSHPACLAASSNFLFFPFVAGSSQAADDNGIPSLIS